MIIRDDRDDIAVLRLSHGKVSALDLPFCEALGRELESVRDGRWRALVLTGTGSTFSAGVDLFRILDQGDAYIDRFLVALDTLLRTLVTLPKPTVAAVNGHAIAGGCIMAQACDHRIMASGTGRIGVSELVVGVPFPPLPLEIVLSRAEWRTARQLVLFGENVAPDDAVRLGLMDEVAPAADVLGLACERAQRLAAAPPAAYALTKENLWRPVLERVDARTDLATRTRAAWHSPDVHAAIRRSLDRTIGRG